MCTLVNNEDDGAALCFNNTTSGNEVEIADGVVINATEVNGFLGGGDDAHIMTDDGSIGTPINKSSPEVVQFADASAYPITNLVASSSRR